MKTLLFILSVVILGTFTRCDKEIKPTNYGVIVVETTNVRLNGDSITNTYRVALDSNDTRESILNDMIKQENKEISDLRRIKYTMMVSISSKDTTIILNHTENDKEYLEIRKGKLLVSSYLSSGKEYLELYENNNKYTTVISYFENNLNISHTIIKTRKVRERYFISENEYINFDEDWFYLGDTDDIFYTYKKHLDN